MKVTMYLDTFPGCTYFSATSQPGMKPEGWKRYAITIDLPDVNQPDAVAPAHELKEVDVGL